MAKANLEASDHSSRSFSPSNASPAKPASELSLGQICKRKGQLSREYKPPWECLQLGFAYLKADRPVAAQYRRAHSAPAPALDTDLLLIAPPSMLQHKSIGHLSNFFYPWEKFAADARADELFVCHIVREAKPVFDPLG